METFLYILDIVLKLIVGLGILNVWLLRRNESSEWRGGNADDIQEEFAAYGLPKSVMIIVGTLKCILAVVLIASIYFIELESVAAYGIAVLMIGAIIMHIKIGDEAKKSLPAFILLALTLMTLWV